MTSILVVVLLSSVLGAGASQAPSAFTASANPTTDAVRMVFARDSKRLIASAELMPAEKYGYRPTEAQMTFGQLMVHVVQTNVAICSGIGDLAMLPIIKLDVTALKDTIVAAVKESFGHCEEALAKTTDARLADEVSMMGKPTGLSRAAALITIANDWADHYSTAASYLRLNGILPPSAKPAK